MKKEYEEAFYEIDEIFKIMPIDLLSKIPKEFREMISENKSKDYKIKIEEPLEEQHLKKETIIILGLIYRDFFADPEEREDLQLKDTEAIKKVEEELNQKYDMENVFNKRKTKKNVNNSPEEMGLTVYKERFIKKIFNLIKGIFKK